MSIHVENRNKIRQADMRQSYAAKTCTAKNSLFQPCQMTVSDAISIRTTSPTSPGKGKLHLP